MKNETDNVKQVSFGQTNSIIENKLKLLEYEFSKNNLIFFGLADKDKEADIDTTNKILEFLKIFSTFS